MISMETVIVLAIACVIAIVLVQAVVGCAKQYIDKPINDYYKKHPKQEKNKLERKEIKMMPVYMGRVEAPLYVLAYYLNQPQFIGLWLILKAAGNWQFWNPPDPEIAHVSRAKYMSFMMKSGLSIGISVLIAIAAANIIKAIST